MDNVSKIQYWCEIGDLDTLCSDREQKKISLTILDNVMIPCFSKISFDLLKRLFSDFKMTENVMERIKKYQAPDDKTLDQHVKELIKDIDAGTISPNIFECLSLTNKIFFVNPSILNKIVKAKPIQRKIWHHFQYYCSTLQETEELLFNLENNRFTYKILERVLFDVKSCEKQDCINFLGSRLVFFFLTLD